MGGRRHTSKPASSPCLHQLASWSAAFVSKWTLCGSCLRFESPQWHLRIFSPCCLLQAHPWIYKCHIPELKNATSLLLSPQVTPAMAQRWDLPPKVGFFFIFIFNSTQQTDQPRSSHSSRPLLEFCFPLPVFPSPRLCSQRAGEGNIEVVSGRKGWFDFALTGPEESLGLVPTTDRALQKGAAPKGEYSPFPPSI